VGPFPGCLLPSLVPHVVGPPFPWHTGVHSSCLGVCSKIVPVVVLRVLTAKKLPAFLAPLFPCLIPLLARQCGKK